MKSLTSSEWQPYLCSKESGLLLYARIKFSSLLLHIEYIKSHKISTLSAFILLLNQSSKDIEKIVEALEISEEQLNYVIDSPSGCGLIKCGSRMVPFDNVIDKDSELYRLYNTNLYEKMENSKEDE